MLQLTSVDLKKEKTDTLVIPVCEDKTIHEDKTIQFLIKTAKKIEEFKGKKGDEIILYDMTGVKAGRVIFSGLGKLDKVDAEGLRIFSGKTVKTGIKKELTDILIAAPASGKMKMEESEVIEAILEGACLGNHIFDKYKKEKKLKPIKKICLLVNADTAKKHRKLVSRVAAVCEGTILAREWVTTPSNDKKPEQLARSIVTLAGKVKLKTTILNEKQLKAGKFGSLLAVSAGSQNKPALVILEYNPGNAKKTIAFVGKGVTFDSGGINLKPTSGLSDMKIDMSGAAAVAATLITAAKLKPGKKVIGVIPLVENMPSGSAARPGDIIKSYSGKTVEIGNTDAEGRLILIDAISYTIRKYKPHTIIDMATLTGACVVALGDKIAGVFSPDDKLADAIVKSGKKTHERCWRMPLPDDYKELIKSDLADIKNMSSSRWGGAITAALFLSDFVGDTPWAHIDIAGPAAAAKEGAYCGSGGTGFGVRLLSDLTDRL